MGCLPGCGFKKSCSLNFNDTAREDCGSGFDNPVFLFASENILPFAWEQLKSNKERILKTLASVSGVCKSVTQFMDRKTQTGPLEWSTNDPHVRFKNLKRCTNLRSEPFFHLSPSNNNALISLSSVLAARWIKTWTTWTVSSYAYAYKINIVLLLNKHKWQWWPHHQF